MNERIWSERVRSCASISGTVSGIGTGISAGSTPDDRSGVDAGGARGVIGIAFVILVAGTVFGSFENPSKLKSKRCSWSPALNVTFANIGAGKGRLPIG